MHSDEDIEGADGGGGGGGYADAKHICSDAGHPVYY